ncbi:MAG: helix-turn-helix domain-containing protein [Fibromonadales bacterium]|nr:helix-turn-helix domain-containing protein [Fibromonadales bacterium]
MTADLSEHSKALRAYARACKSSLTKEEAAEHCGMAVKTFEKHARLNGIPYEQRGDFRFYPKSGVERFMGDNEATIAMLNYEPQKGRIRRN